MSASRSSEGEIFGFIGPNGAGKTTTIKTLLGLLFPTAGKAMVLGKPAGDIEAKERISYLPESPYFYEHMTGAEVLDFYCQLFRMDKVTRRKKVGELLERVGLGKDGSRALRQYSKGMLQRVGIAQALINDPDLLFFDEPTSGLDPIAHKDIQDLIAEPSRAGQDRVSQLAPAFGRRARLQPRRDHQSRRTGEDGNAGGTAPRGPHDRHAGLRERRSL